MITIADVWRAAAAQRMRMEKMKARKVKLLVDVPRLGKKGEVVLVKGRRGGKLIARGLAEPA